MNNATFATAAGRDELLSVSAPVAVRLSAAMWLLEAAGHGAGDWGEAGSETRAARLAYGMDVPEIGAHVVEQFVFWMRFAPEPMRNQAALELCRHIASVKKADPADWRAIIAEAVDVIGAYVEERESADSAR
jgi:hypothetical protein